VDQEWNGAAAILNKNPINMNITPKLTPLIIWPDTDIKLYIDSKFVKPVKVYINPEPSKIKQEDKAPNKKYFKPEAVADS